MAAKERITRTRVKQGSNVEEMLARLMAELAELKAERVAPSTNSELSASKPKKKTLQKVKVEGTGSVFWEVTKPMTIRQADADNGRYYKSADGKRIRVFFVNKNFPQSPIIGALEIQPGVWDARVWNYDGGMRTPYGHGSNIVGFWEE